MHRIFGFLDNDLRYNLIIPFVFAVIVLCNIISGCFLTIGGAGHFNAIIIFPMYMFSYFWSAAAMIALDHQKVDLIDNGFVYNFIDIIVKAMHSIWGTVIFTAILIVPVVIARIIFSEKRIRLYRRLIIIEYIVMSVISFFYFVPLIIFCFVAFSVISMIVAVVSGTVLYLMYRIVKRGIQNTMSDSILNFCKDKAG